MKMMKYLFSLSVSSFNLSFWRVCFLLVFSSLQHECQGSNNAFFYKDESSRLVNNLIKKVSVLSLVECNLNCLRDGCCVSTNYEEPTSCGDMEDNCELNYARASEKPDDFVKNGTVDYYEMINSERVSNFCCSSPCQDGSICDAERKTCDPVLGHTKEFPGKSCQDIKDRSKNSSSNVYWIKPDRKVFQVYCDMETDVGGWTLVYRYNFTDYSNFYVTKNAVTPRPNWPVSIADVSVSVTPPLDNSSVGAVDFNEWRHIGEKFMIKSNIADSYICMSENGSIVTEMNGTISCKRHETVVKNCTSKTIPENIAWEVDGPRIMNKNLETVFQFEGSTTRSFPTHNLCNGTSKNHKKDVADPMGEIYLQKK